MNCYFIGPDAHDDLWVWRERGDYPVPVLGQRDLRDDLELWDAIVATIAALDTAADPDTPTPTRWEVG